MDQTQQLWDAARAVQDGVVTVRELSQHTTQVLRAVHDAQRPVLVSRHGRVVAKIVPTTLRDELGAHDLQAAESTLRAGADFQDAEEEAASRKWGSAEELRHR